MVSSPTTNPNEVTTLLISTYDINSNPVAYNLLRINISPYTTLLIRDPTNNVNEIYFLVNGTMAQDSHQFTVGVMLQSVLGSFTAENLYVIVIITPPNINSLMGTTIYGINNGDVLTFSTESSTWQNQQPTTFSTYRYQYTYQGTFTSPAEPTMYQGALYLDTTNNMCHMNLVDSNNGNHLTLLNNIGYGSIIEILISPECHQRFVIININRVGGSYIEYKYDSSLSMLEGTLSISNTYDVEIHYQTIKGIDDLEGVDISTPLQNQLLTYDTTSGGWINKDPPQLTQLTGVNASSPANNNALTWQSSSNSWIPQSVTSLGIFTVIGGTLTGSFTIYGLEVVSIAGSCQIVYQRDSSLSFDPTTAWFTNNTGRNINLYIISTIVALKDGTSNFLRMFPNYTCGALLCFPMEVVQSVNANDQVTLTYSGLIQLSTTTTDTTANAFQMSYSSNGGNASCMSELCAITVWEV